MNPRSLVLRIRINANQGVYDKGHSHSSLSRFSQGALQVICS